MYVKLVLTKKWFHSVRKRGLVWINEILRRLRDKPLVVVTTKGSEKWFWLCILCLQSVNNYEEFTLIHVIIAHSVTITVRLLGRSLVPPVDHCPQQTLVKPLLHPRTRSFASWNMFMLSPSLLITPSARAHWGFCLDRDAWGLCLRRVDERSAVRQQTAWKQKDSFSCSHTLEQSQRQLFPSRVSQTFWLDLPLVSLSPSLSFSLSHPPCLLLMYESMQMNGPTKVVQRTGDELNTAPPPVRSVPSCARHSVQFE